MDSSKCFAKNVLPNFTSVYLPYEENNNILSCCSFTGTLEAIITIYNKLSINVSAKNKIHRATIVMQSV